MRKLVSLAAIGTLLLAATLAASDLADFGNPWVPGPAMASPKTVDSLEIFGSTAASYGPSGSRCRGNIFRCDVSSILTEQRVYLNPTTSDTIIFMVYESTTDSVGTYNLIDSVTIPAAGTGAGWYSSGTRNVPLQAGKFYVVLPQWKAAANYYNQQGITPYPIPASFGAHVGQVGMYAGIGYANPPAATVDLTIDFFGAPVAYYAAVVTHQNPTVTWTSPACCAVGVHPAQPIKVAFSEPMDQGSVSFSSTPAVSASMYWNAAGDTLIIDPDGNLSPSTNYVFQIYGNDQYGHPLGAGAASNPFDFITAGGDSMEYIGSTTQIWSGAPRMRGNFFLCDANTIVKEYKWYLDPADTANVWFAIYEGSTAGGTFNLKFSRMVRTPDIAAGWYTTGPMNFRMETGKYYFYAMLWDSSVSVSYYRSESGSNPYPYPCSFGDLVGLCGYGYYPDPIIPLQDTLEVSAGAFSGNMAYYQQLLTIPENPAPPILVLEETPGDTLHYYHQAASNLGYATRVVTNQSAFVDSLYNGTPWTMALVNNFHYAPITGFFDTLNHYLNNGGRMVFFTYDYASAGSMYNSLGASYIGGLEVPMNVHANDPTDVLFTTPNAITDLYWKNDIFATNCIRLAPINGGLSAAYLEGYPGEAGLVVNGAQTAIINGFEAVNYTGDDDTDGKLDMVELIENEIVWLLGPTSVGVEGPSTSLGGPARMMLGANYPNPFRTSTSIEFALPQAGRASLKVYNVLGQTVATLVDGELSAGRHHARWNARGVANGVYLYRLEADGQRMTRKLAVVR